MGLAVGVDHLVLEFQAAHFPGILNGAAQADGEHEDGEDCGGARRDAEGGAKGTGACQGLRPRGIIRLTSEGSLLSL